MHHPSIHFEKDSTGRFVTTVIGDLDAGTTPLLREAFRTAAFPPDVVDLRFVGLLSASAISVLLEAFERRAFRTVGSVIVERVLTILELDERLGLHRPDGPPCLVTAPFGVSVHDADLRFLYLNDTLAEINGLPAPIHLGHRLDELFVIERDDITQVMRSVWSSHQPRTVRVNGMTSASTGSWLCCYRPGRYVEHTDALDVVVATVEPDGHQCASREISFTTHRESG